MKCTEHSQTIYCVKVDLNTNFWRCPASIIRVDVVNDQRVGSEDRNEHQPVCHSVSQWQRVVLCWLS